MHQEKIEIETTDGICPAHFFSPNKNHPGPSVLFYMDAGGIRPAVVKMAERLANAGYSVLLPDLFYRYGPYGPFVPKEVLAGDMMATLGPLIATTGNSKCAADTEVFIPAIDERTGNTNANVGVVGFCMGGGMAVASAGTCPDRIAAAVSFHGGNLATDAPDSPHNYASRLQAKLYIASATNDDSYPAEMANRFENALSEAGVAYTAKTYPAAHGWMKPDFPVYDEDAAEDGWRSMLNFFEQTLR